MSLAQPTLDLIMLEQISDLKNTLEKLNMSILNVNKSVNDKLEILTDKVEKQDAVIQQLLTTEHSQPKIEESIKEEHIDNNKVKKIEDDINVNDKNIKLNRKEIENLYRVVNTYKEENKIVVEEIKNIKIKMEVLNDNSTENSVKIMNTLNDYIVELKSNKPNQSYANVTQTKVISNISSSTEQNTRNDYNSAGYSSNNYRRNSYNNSSYNRYTSPKNSDEEGWQTVKSKKKSSTFRRY